MPWVSELPYAADSSSLFEAVAHRPWAMFLDSGYPNTSDHWDILVADPIATIVSRNGVTELRQPTTGVVVSRENPFVLLRHILGTPVASIADLPFAGGCVGWFGYDLACDLVGIPKWEPDLQKLPDLAVGIFDWAVVVNHQAQRAWLASYGQHGTTANWGQLLEIWGTPPRHPLSTWSTVPVNAVSMQRPFRVLDAPSSNLHPQQYAAIFERVQRYIHDGDCYQINLAQRFASRVEGDPWSAYKTLRHLNPAPLAAYLTTPFGQILSSSPERFLRMHDGLVETRPIKGTRPRGIDADGDEVLAHELLTSTKDQAENLMIVDLLRNDLGKVCIPGSIRVPELFALERFATVQHLVSTIMGRLNPSQDAIALLQACFPGGSVTGAPKLRAMQIIRELEPHPREVYCGVIGYIGFDGAMDTNIAIRTMVHKDGNIRFWAGGGIVYDSVMEQEYAETLHKAKAMLQLMQVAT